MSKSLRGRLLAAVFCAGALGAFAAPACAETLADALALAYDTNPNLLSQRSVQRALDEGYVQARAGFRPTLSLQASANEVEFRTPRAARGIPIDTNGDGIPDTVLPATGSGISRTNDGNLGL